MRSCALEFASWKIRSVSSAAPWTRRQAAQLFSTRHGHRWNCSALFVAELPGKLANTSVENGLSFTLQLLWSFGEASPGRFSCTFPPVWGWFYETAPSGCLVAKSKCYQEVLLQSAQPHSTECLWQKIALCRLHEVLRGSWIPWGSCRRGKKKAFFSKYVILMQSCQSAMVCCSCFSEASRLIVFLWEQDIWKI